MSTRWDRQRNLRIGEARVRIGPTDVVLTVQKTCNPPRQAANCTLFSFITCTTRGGYNQSCGRDTTTNLKGRQKSRRLLRAVSSTLARATQSDPDHSGDEPWTSESNDIRELCKNFCAYAPHFAGVSFWHCYLAHIIRHLTLPFSFHWILAKNNLNVHWNKAPFKYNKSNFY